MSHARLSPSDARRWLNCPAAIVFDDKYPEPDDALDIPATLAAWNDGSLDVKDLSAAERGTLAHALAEEALCPGSLSQADIGLLETLVSQCGLYDNAMAYVAAIENEIVSGVTTWEVERKVQLWYEPGSVGTIDFLAVHGDTLIVVDYKSGAQPVDVSDSAQLAIYGIAAEDELSLFHEIKCVHVGICQPAIDEEIQWRAYERGALDGLRKLVDDTAAMLALPGFEPYPRVTTAGCQWCRHKARCPAQEAAALAALEAPGIELLTAEQLSEIQAGAAGTRKFLDAVEEYVRENLSLFPAFELGSPKVTRYDWLDTETVAGVLRAHGVEPWREPALISYTEAKKALPREARAELEPLVEAVHAAKRPLIAAGPKLAGESTESALEKLSN